MGSTTGILHLATSGALFDCDGIHLGWAIVYGLRTFTFSTAMENAINNIISKLLQLRLLVRHKSMEISAQFCNMCLYFRNIRLKCMDFVSCSLKRELVAFLASFATRSTYFLLAVIALGTR